MTLFRRIAVAAVAFAMAAPSLAQPVKLGELNSYKVFPAFLEPYKKGMELALAEVNAAGGVLGRPLEIVSRDDNGTPGDAVRVAEELTSREKVVDADRHISVERRPGRRRLRQAAQDSLSRRGAADRQDRLGKRQQVHVPAARVDVHADRDARARGGQAQQEALGNRVSQLRVWAIGHRGVQEADELFLQSGGLEFIEVAVPLGKIDAGAGGAGAARRAAGRHLFVAVRRRTWPGSYARASCAASSTTVRCSTCWAANPNTWTR